MKYVGCLFLLISWASFAQKMELAPMIQNTSIEAKSNLKSNGSLDSSFVFKVDTLSLPFLDDFSTNKFQSYKGDYSAAGVTNQVYYKLLNNSNSTPFPSTTFFTNQLTFKRTYDIVNNVFTDSIFPAIQVKVGDLDAYPIQYQTLDVYPPYFIYDTIGIPNFTDTVWLNNPIYYQDSVRIFNMSINEPSKLWIDSYAYHNYRYAMNPRSLGVVTFDGLDQNGFPYLINTAVTNYADRLTSKPVDLSGLSASDSVYLSFLYQPEGFGDIPEASDSLIVEFYAKDLDQWFRVWSTEGDAVCPFKAAHLKITESKYFKKGFQFRFRNYGSLAGALDNFHVDYVHLRALSSYDDTLFKDFAFVYPLNSLIKEYTSVPWDHYKNSAVSTMTDSLLIRVYNGSSNPENYQNGQLNFSYNGLITGSYILQGFNLAGQNINFSPRTFHTSFHNLSNGAQFDKSLAGNEQLFEVKANASAQFPNDAVNDSTSFVQRFYNYYSYDDGSAEAAFGPTGTQSRLAIAFESYEEDSIIGVNMHFVPSVNNVSGKLFLISVWSDNNGKPGNLLYEDDAFSPRSPVYKNGLNPFYSYYFRDTTKVAIGKKFHVGWRQLDGDRLNLGLDRNIDHSDKIKFSVDGGNQWLSSPFPGSAMIRPIFSTALDPTIGLTENTLKVKLFPNPTDGKLSILLSDGKEINLGEIIDFTGRILFKFTGNELDFSSLNDGIYFLRIPNLPGKLFKVVKQ